MTKYFSQLNRERSTAPFIPYSSHVNATTIITKDGDYMRIWKLSGISFETLDQEELFQRKIQLNTLFRSIGSNQVSLWTHCVRRQTSDRLLAEFDNDFCRDFDKKYFDSFVGYSMMANELYLTVIYRPHTSRVQKFFARQKPRSRNEILKDQQAALRKLDDIAYQIESSMSRYGLEVLGTYEDEKGVVFSRALEFLNFLLSGEWQKVRLPTAPLNEYLGTAWIFVGTETIEIRSPTKTKFAQCIDFKDYNSHTEPGILNGLMFENYEYVVTQSFSFMPKPHGKSFLEQQMNQFQNTEDGSVTQVVQMEEAIDQLINGDFTMGEYHYSLMVFGDSIEQVRRNTTSAMTVLQDEGFLAALVVTATDAAFYAQLPCNWRYRPRVAVLTSNNFAGLSCFHNFASGKRDGNPWGQAVTLFKTQSGQPFYFNFHYSSQEEDSFNKKPLGNTRVIGKSGTGKTALLGMLLIESQKYKHNSPLGYTSVFFDKDRAAELLIRVIGGKYLVVKNGQPTGFNPFQIEPNEENILFLEKLVRILASRNNQSVTTADEQRISHAVRTVMRMPHSLRRLMTVTQNMTEGSDKHERENSIVKRLSRWCEGGSLGWVFDNPVDQVNFESYNNYGFDGTSFLDNSDICTPISMYLLHRMESIIDGRRFIYFMDEAWKWVNDQAFSEFVGDKQLTIRKQNGLGVFATQMPSSFLQSKIASSLVQQVATEIYLPNPRADYHEYVKGFKLSAAEFEIVKNMGEESRSFLVKQGANSVLARLDLSGFDDELAILSGSPDAVQLLDEIIEEVGDDPMVWLPIFHERRKARAAGSMKIWSGPNSLEARRH